MDSLIRGHDYLQQQYPGFKLIGRSAELRKLTSILVRKEANSVILVGAGGVGCSAICMALQALKTDPATPFDLVSKRLFWLQADVLFASGDIGEINGTFQRIMQVLDRTPDSILIIEDTRDFIEACKNNSCTHFVNALVVAVRSNRTQVILETRDDDLEQVMKCHSDLREYFTLMEVLEPTPEVLKEIATDMGHRLTEFHGVRIAQDAIDTAIELTNKYRTRDPSLSRAQPERSMTLLDRALASYRLNAHNVKPGTNPAWDGKQQEIRRLYNLQREGETAILELEAELDEVQKREAASVASRIAELDNPRMEGRAIGGFAKLANSAGFESDQVKSIRTKIASFQKAVDENRGKFDSLTSEINASLELTRAEVLKEFSVISGIDVAKLTEDEYELLRNLEPSLKRHIFGQDHAVEKLSSAIKRARISNRKAEQPVAFMFLGPSGVGKSELAKRLASYLQLPLTILDMSDYMEKHAVAKMIGAPPGYEGFEAGGILTNAVRKLPRQLVLFDEIEKAHPDVFNVLLQVLGDGRLNDNLGRECAFRDVICIFTTNIGQSYYLDPDNTMEVAQSLTMEELDHIYRPEFLNRFEGRQNIVCFNSLQLDSIERIVRRELQLISESYIGQGITTSIADNVFRAFCRDNYDPKIGARGLPAVLRHQVETSYVNAILERPDDKRAASITYDEPHHTLRVEMRPALAEAANG